MIKNFLQGRFMGHPLHPMLVHLPVGLWVASLISDIFFMATGNGNFAAASFYAIGLGIVVALIAALAGLADLIDIPRDTVPQRIALTHALLNLIVLSIYVLSFFLRGDFVNGPTLLVTGPQLLLNLISVALLSVSGYLGGTLVYQHGVGHRSEPKRSDKIRRVA